MLKLEAVQTVRGSPVLIVATADICTVGLLFLLNVSVIHLTTVRLKYTSTNGKMPEETQIQIGECK
jgi:hypothetical protein